MLIYCRLRRIPQADFVEIYVHSVSEALELPKAPVKRFHGRSSQVLPGLYKVDSCAFDVQTRRLADIRSHGAWISFGDLALRGSTPTQEAKATYFGLEISEATVQYLWANKGLIETVGPVGPMAVYHGTDKANVKDILRDGFHQSFGMLGTAIYFGSFWKAFRFATLTQDYEPRSGAVLRCYASWPSVKVLDGQSKCTCSLCCSRCPGGNPQADHEALWAESHTAVAAVPLASWPKGIKNEEFACRDSSTIHVDSVAFVKSSTEHHEPYNRSLCIL